MHDGGADDGGADDGGPYNGGSGSDAGPDTGSGCDGGSSRNAGSDGGSSRNAGSDGGSSCNASANSSSSCDFGTRYIAPTKETVKPTRLKSALKNLSYLILSVGGRRRRSAPGCNTVVYNYTSVCTPTGREFEWSSDYLFDFEFTGHTGRYFKTEYSATPIYIEVDVGKNRFLRYANIIGSVRNQRCP